MSQPSLEKAAMRPLSFSLPGFLLSATCQECVGILGLEGA